MNISGCGESSSRRLGSRLTVASQDDDGVLVSEIRSEADTVGLWTRSREIVLIAKEYVRHDIWGRIFLDELGEGGLEHVRERSPLARILLDQR
jgi:hypothetical protein